MSKVKKTFNILSESKRIADIIREKVISEAIVTNKKSGFMNEQEFENEIRQLTTLGICEATREIGSWYVSKMWNEEVEKIQENNKNESSNEIIEVVNKLERDI